MFRERSRVAILPVKEEVFQVDGLWTALVFTWLRLTFSGGSVLLLGSILDSYLLFMKLTVKNRALLGGVLVR